MKRTVAFVVLYCTLVLCSCATSRPDFQELPLPPEKIVQTGYSVIPPNEPGWLVAGRDPSHVAIIKRREGQNETLAIQVMLVTLPGFTNTDELAQLIKEGQVKGTDPQRFKTLKHEVLPYRAMEADCAKSHALSEDTAAVKESEQPRIMFVEVATLTCAHPRNKKVGVHISYSYRYSMEQKDPQFAEKASSVLNSVEFNELWD